MIRFFRHLPSPLGTFATGGCDGTISTWDSRNRRKLAQLRRYPTRCARHSDSYPLFPSNLIITHSYSPLPRPHSLPQPLTHSPAHSSLLLTLSSSPLTAALRLSASTRTARSLLLRRPTRTRRARMARAAPRTRSLCAACRTPRSGPRREHRAVHSV